MTPLDARIPQQLLTDIDAAEGDSLVAYLDTAVPPNWTIGRGHELPRPMVGQTWAGFTISQAVSDRYLQEDILKVYPWVEKLAEWPKMDTPCRQNALREIGFNMRTRWNSFTVTRAAAVVGNWRAVHDGLLDSEWAKQVQPHEWVMGLCKVCHQPEATSGPRDYCKGRDGRATRLARYFLKGQYP